MTPPPTYRAAGFFILRTPLDPFNGLSRARDLVDPATGGEDLDSLVADLRSELRKALDRPEVKEALHLASRSLLNNLHYWLDDPDSDKARRVEASLIRYLSRMAGRPTPFGIFAGISLGEISDHTNFILGPVSSYKRVTRLDSRRLVEMLHEIREDPKVRKHLRFRSNPTLYRLGPRLRFIERRPGPTGYSYFLSSIHSTDAIERLLSQARAGKKVTEFLAEVASHEDELPFWQNLIDELIAAGVLLDDLEPPVTGDEPLPTVVKSLPDRIETVRHLRDAAAQMERGDAEGIGLPASFYEEIRQTLSASSPGELTQSVAVSLVKPAEGLMLAESIVAEVLQGVRLLHEAGDPSEHDEELAAFREAFLRRYGEGRLMPLLEVLDPEAGIGFGLHRRVPESARVLEGLGFSGRTIGVDAPWSKRDLHLLQLAETAWRSKDVEIELKDADLQALTSSSNDPLPDSLTAIAALEAESAAHIDSGDYRLFLRMGFGPSGGSILGASCSLDLDLREQVRGFLQAEERLQPGAVFAEVVHLPDAYAGNIPFRPLLRDYEIPIFGGSGAEPERQILLTDLTVTVKNDRITLYSSSLSREIVPRLSCAHNYRLSHFELYRFLSTLQLQGVHGLLQWSWGRLERAAFLPRVVAGRLIIARARWRLESERSRAWYRMDRSDRLEQFSRWKSEVNLPRFVLDVTGDLELPVDTHNPLEIEALLFARDQRRTLVLEEMLPVPPRLPVKGPAGRFVHEIILPLVRTQPRSAVGPPVTRIDARARAFGPWSDWLYVKLYTGEHTADRLLTEVLGPLIVSLKEQGLIDKWHYVRYVDPEHHIRLRLHSLNRSSWLGSHIEAAVERASQDGLARRVQIDTYEREVERYGGPEAIDLAESAFDADSDSALAVLTMLRNAGTASTLERWNIVAIGVDRLLSDFGLDLQAKKSLCEAVTNGYREEFELGSKQRQLIGQRYRTHRAEFERTLKGGADGLWLFLESTFEYRSSRLIEVAKRFRILEQQGRLTSSLTDVVISLAHMHANRILPDFQREQELIVYEFLSRAYESMRARSVEQRHQ